IHGLEGAIHKALLIQLIRGRTTQWHHLHHLRRRLLQALRLLGVVYLIYLLRYCPHQSLDKIGTPLSLSFPPAESSAQQVVQSLPSSSSSSSSSQLPPFSRQELSARLQQLSKDEITSALISMDDELITLRRKINAVQEEARQGKGEPWFRRGLDAP